MKPLASRLQDLRASTGPTASVTEAKPRILRTLSILAVLCSLAVLLLGTVVIIGWIRNYQPALNVLPGHRRMMANTAILFIISGLSLLLALLRFSTLHLWSRILAALVVVFALLTLSEYLFKIDLHIDQLFIRDYWHVRNPGRMAPISALDFVVAGLALSFSLSTPFKRLLKHTLGLVLAILAIFSIVVTLYGVSAFDGVGSYSAIAIHTSVGFLLLASGILLSSPDFVTLRMIAAPGVSGWLVRRALPAVIILPILLGWLYLKSNLELTGLRFGMAIFTISLVAAASAGLWLVSLFLSRAERQRAEIDLIREDAAAAVRQSEHELRIVTDQLPTLISYVDPDGLFIRVNRTYEQWTGVPAAQIVGRTIRELLGENYWQQTASYRNAALDGSTITFDIDYPTRSGVRRSQVTYAPDFDERPADQSTTNSNPSVRGIVCMVLDIEEQRRAEAAIRQSEKLAVVGRLASSIAHEINNPLEAVTNLLYLVEQESPSGSAARGYVQLAQQELARVTHIVVQTLRFHRQSHLPVRCHVSDMTQQVLALYQGRLGQAHIDVRSRLRATEPLLCRDGEIRQVLANLIGNSAEAMAANPTGDHPHPRLLHLRTRIATCPRTGASGIRVTVADSGHGISAETRKTLFQPFHTTKGATGSGLGLWVSKEIIDRHGGSVSVRSSTHPTRHHTVFAVFLAHQNEIPASNPNPDAISTEAAQGT